MNGEKKWRQQNRHGGSDFQKIGRPASDGKHQQSVSQVKDDILKVHEAFFQAPYILVQEK